MTEITNHYSLLSIALRQSVKADLLVEAIEQRHTSAEVYNLALECVELASAIAKANLGEILKLKPPDEPS